MSAAVTSVTTVTPYFTPIAEAPEVVKDRGLAIEPIVGIRAFQIDLEIDQSARLVSFNNIGWPARQPLYGHCLNNLLGDHDVPGETCVCGIYAWNKDNAGMLGGADVTGEVYLWGDVLVAELGYRAEIAYPKSLTIKAKSTRNAIRIRDGLMDAYGIPVDLVEPEPVEHAIHYGVTGATGPAQIFGGVVPATSPYWTTNIYPTMPSPGTGS
jgi:hypothetical protein